MTQPFPLILLSEEFSVCRLAPNAALPPWAERPDAVFTCVVRTGEELSIVCPSRLVPAGILQEPGFCAFKLRGPVPFTTTGVVSSLTTPLAAAGLSVFVLSTYDTDYLLVRSSTLDQAVRALRLHGFIVG